MKLLDMALGLKASSSVGLKGELVKGLAQPSVRTASTIKEAQAMAADVENQFHYEDDQEKTLHLRCSEYKPEKGRQLDSG